MTILHVDDDVNFSEILKDSLEEYFNAQVIKYNCFKKNFNLVVDEVRPNIIIMDLMLGSTNGLCLLKEVKKNYYSRNIPVIILTSVLNEKVCEACFSSGASDYIEKPVALKVLCNAIERVLKK